MIYSKLYNQVIPMPPLPSYVRTYYQHPDLQCNDVPVEAPDLRDVDRVGDIVQDEGVDVVIPG